MSFRFVFVFVLLCCGSILAQPKLKSGSLKATNISTQGFTINIETFREVGYQAEFIPIKNSVDTLYFEHLEINSESHQLQIEGLSGSAFYNAYFKFFDESKDTLYYKKTYATSSIQPGEILAYFNHEINEAVASSEDNIAHYINNATRDTLINYIGRAQESIDIAIYNSFGNNPTNGIAGAINQAYLDGVQVRVIHDGSTSSTMINVLNSNIPIIQRLENPNFPGIMHHKFLIIDAEHEDASKSVVWTGSTNWTTGQINSPDKNNVIIFQDQTLAQTFKMEFDEMWGSSGALPNFQNIKFGSTKQDNTPKEFNVGGIDVECYFSPSDGTEQEILNLIENAQESIVTATMLITRENLAQALVDQYNNGINELAFLVDTEDYSGSKKDLLENNLGPNNYYEYTANGIMHHKMMVVDHGTPQATVLTGSHNWSFSAENRNDENTVIIHDEAIANQYYQAISQLYLDVEGTLSNKDIEEVILSFFPNPLKDKLYIKHLGENFREIQIYNQLGRKVHSQLHQKNSKIQEINFRDFKAGFYFVKLISDKQDNINIKIIKQ